jgi:hypothetical protein
MLHVESPDSGTSGSWSQSDEHATDTYHDDGQADHDGSRERTPHL